METGAVWRDHVARVVEARHQAAAPTTPGPHIERAHRCEACGLAWRYDLTGSYGAANHTFAYGPRHHTEIVLVPSADAPG